MATNIPPRPKYGIKQHTINKYDGKKFAYWTVLCFSHKTGPTKKYFVCRCECGKTKPVLIGNLLNGESMSCGCRPAKIPPPPGPRQSTLDKYIGKKYGHWTVLAFSHHHESRKGAGYFNCRCICGTVKAVDSRMLHGGQSKSCGCINRLPSEESAIRKLFGIYKKGPRSMPTHLTLRGQSSTY